MKRRIANLDVIEIQGAADGPCVVMLHGYGADFHDLAPLAREIPVPDGTSWYFPNAPIEFAVNPLWSGRGWFPIDEPALEAAIAEGRHRDFASNFPEGMAEAAAMVDDFLQELGRDFRDIYLGGFSQGAMVACEVALARQEVPRGLILLSCTLVSRKRWEPRIKDHSKLRVFQSHGMSDVLLSHEDARTLHAIFKQHIKEAQFMDFPGGHEIPYFLLKHVGSFIK